MRMRSCRKTAPCRWTTPCPNLFENFNNVKDLVDRCRRRLTMTTRCDEQQADRSWQQEFKGWTQVQVTRIFIHLLNTWSRLIDWLIDHSYTLSLRYSNHLNTGLVWYSNGRSVLGCKMVWYSNGGMKTVLKKACLWSKMSGIQNVRQVMWLYQLNTRYPYCLVFRWIQYSDGYCIATGIKALCRPT